MDNETRYTEDEVRRRERKAWLSGRKAAAHDHCGYLETQFCGICDEEARARYPIKKKVPRVVQIGGTGREYRIKDGWLQVRAGGLDLWSNMVFRAVEIRDLLDNPEQEIEE
jgi:hypothetical protein